MMAMLSVIFVPWTWLSDEPTPMKIALLVLLLVLGMVATLLLAAASALTAASVKDRELRFTFCGLTTRRIPLRSITGFEPFGRSWRWSPLRIFYGKRWYCPNGLLDHNELACLLESHGFSQGSAADLRRLGPRLDEDIDLDELAELAQNPPAKRYLDSLVRQLAAGQFTSRTLSDSDPLPRPTHWYDEELPSFEDVHQRLRRMSRLGPDQRASPIELIIDGVGWDLTWTSEETAAGRRLHLSIRRSGT